MKRQTLFLLCFLMVGCDTVIRKSGQVELFSIHPTDQKLVRAQSVEHEQEMIEIGATRGAFNPTFGDRVRLNSDVLCINVHSIYLDALPTTLTGSHDVIVFADVWEDGADGYDSPSLTSVVYAGKNQKIPGKCNCNGQVIYGPTPFKGHPLKIKFTIMVLQTAQGEKEGAVADVVQNAAKAIPTYGIFVSQAAAVMRDVLKAQPDVICFDYETTFLSDKPAGQIDILLRNTGGASSGSMIARNIQNRALTDAVTKAQANIVRTNFADWTWLSNITDTVALLKRQGVPDDLAPKIANEAKASSLNFARNQIASARTRVSSYDAPHLRDLSQTLTAGLNALDSGSELNDFPVQNALEATVKIAYTQHPFDTRFGWLQYGFYALVETEPLTKAVQVTQPEIKTRQTADEITVHMASTNAFDPDCDYFYEGGWLFKNDTQSTRKITRNRLKSKYLIFSVTPGQQDEGKDVLLAASKANASFLQSVRQTPENLKAVKDDIDKTVGSLKRTILKNRVKGFARGKASMMSTKEKFEAGKADLKQKIEERAETWSNDMGLEATEAKAVAAEILSELEDSFSALN